MTVNQNRLQALISTGSHSKYHDNTPLKKEAELFFKTIIILEYFKDVDQMFNLRHLSFRSIKTYNTEELLPLTKALHNKCKKCMIHLFKLMKKITSFVKESKLILPNDYTPDGYRFGCKSEILKTLKITYCTYSLRHYGDIFLLFIKQTLDHHCKVRELKEFNISKDKTIEWITVANLPVSNDKSHCPPEEFIDDAKKINTRLVRSPKYGEIELLPVKGKETYYRIIYRTDNFVTLSLLKNEHPVGPTLYRPSYESVDLPFPMRPLSFDIKRQYSKSTLKKIKYFLQQNPFTWHLSSKTITNDRTIIRLLCDEFVKHKLVYLRSINADNDANLIISGQPLQGSGTSKNICTQVKGNVRTKLLSVSTEIKTDFSKSQTSTKKNNNTKRAQNAGFIAIASQIGHIILFDSTLAHPSFIPHRDIVRATQNNPTLTQRVLNAKEAMYSSPIPLEIVIYFDDGVPSISGGKKKKTQSNKRQKLNKRVSKLIEQHNTTYESLPEQIKKKLTNVSRKKMIKILNEYFNDASK